MTIEKRKALLYKSCKRGCRETDILLGNFARDNIFSISDDELLQYEQIVAIEDTILYKYLTQMLPTPAEFSLINKIVAFNNSLVEELK